MFIVWIKIYKREPGIDVSTYTHNFPTHGDYDYWNVSDFPYLVLLLWLRLIRSDLILLQTLITFSKTVLHYCRKFTQEHWHIILLWYFPFTFNLTSTIHMHSIFFIPQPFLFFRFLYILYPFMQALISYFKFFRNIDHSQYSRSIAADPPASTGSEESSQFLKHRMHSNRRGLISILLLTVKVQLRLA